MKPLTTNTQQHRQKVSFNVDHTVQEEEMASVKESEPLPIVELKPFVQKVWRREKSFASSWERSPSVATDKSDKTECSNGTAGNRTKETEITPALMSDTGLEEHSASPPPKTSQSLPPCLSERFLTIYVNAFEDFKSQKEHINRFVGESAYKSSKSRLHPSIDPKNKKQPEHSVNIMQGFITRDDRTKTTLDEISGGGSSSRLYSCSPKAIRPDDIRKQQQMRIAGETLYQFKRSTPTESSPTPSKATSNSWHASTVRHGSPASMLYQHKRDQKSKRVKTPLYDHLDRNGILPSLSINATSLQHRESKGYYNGQSEDYIDYAASYDELKHHVGGIQNSLMVLSKHGVPTKVERQISFELEKTLSRFRKLKDYSPFEINPSELAKYYPPPTFNMTQGEEYLRQAMQSNASRHRKRRLRTGISGNGKGASLSSISLSGTQSSQYTHGILKNSYNEVEHIDSFDNLYSPYNKMPSFAYTPDEEPSVPYDTPRSHLDSRVSSKVVDIQTLEIKEETPMEMKLVTDIDTEISKTQKSETKKAKNEHDKENGKDSTTKAKKHVNKSEKKTSTVDIQAVQMATAQPRPSQIDASGRTFLTSDTIQQVAVATA